MSLVKRLRWLDEAYDHAWHTDWAREAADEIERLRAALQRAFKELDDILEDWQLDGRHGQARYEQLKRETDAILAVLKGE